MLRETREAIKRTPIVGPALYDLYLWSFCKEGESIPIVRGALSGYRWKRFMRTYQQSYIDGDYEPQTQNAILSHLKPGMVFYDIGANGGFFTLLAASIVGVTGHVVAFEPHPKTAAQLVQQIRLNRLSNVDAVVSAVSAEIGKSLFDDSTFPVMASLVNGGECTITVSTTTLDNEIQFRRAPDMLKIDVEGAEMKVLRGAERLLKRKPILLVELHSEQLANSYRAFVAERGYVTTMIDGRTALSKSPN